MMLVVPALSYAFMPESVLRVFYIVIVGLFALVCLWVSAEAITAAIVRWRTLNGETSTAWPALAYIVPAYLNNEANILDATLEAYSQLNYRSSITVLLVYNCKGDLSEVSVKELSLTDFPCVLPSIPSRYPFCRYS